jgi:hypothetical protein
VNFAKEGLLFIGIAALLAIAAFAAALSRRSCSAIPSGSGSAASGSPSRRPTAAS